MKLHLNQNQGIVLVKSCSDHEIVIEDQTYRQSIAIRPDGVQSSIFMPASFDALEKHHVEALAALQPEVVLLGTGKTIHWPDPRIVEPLTRLRTGIEVMGTPAACRTYNILVSEGRDVLAALFLDQPE